jgi:hypothetical protein
VGAFKLLGVLPQNQSDCNVREQEEQNHGALHNGQPAVINQGRFMGRETKKRVSYAKIASNHVQDKPEQKKEIAQHKAS